LRVRVTGARPLVRAKPLLIAALVVALAAIPLVIPTDYVLGGLLARDVLDTAATFAIVAVGLNLLTGGTGQFSLGHAGYYAIGAFTAGILNTTYGWPFWLDIPAGGLVAGLFGVVLGVPVLRLSGPYLSIATLGFGLLVAQVLGGADWAGGRSGIALNPAQLGPYTFNGLTFFWVVLAVLALGVFVAHNLRRGATGRAFVALRESESAAQASGVNVARYRVIAFALSALYAGIAGGLFAHWSPGPIFADSFGLPVSVLFVAMIVIGGLDSTMGAIIGAVFLTAVQEVTSGNPQLASTLFGVIIVVALLFMPHGLAGLPALVRRARQQPAPAAVGETHA